MKKEIGKRQSFLGGAAVLTVAAIIVKVIGALYKIPLGNLLGEEGMGHFGVAYTIFNVLQNVATAGLPVAMSRMISAAAVSERPNQIKRIFTVSMMTFVTIGVLGTAVMLLFSQQLATAMNDGLASYAIMALAPSVLLVCITSALRGYTQGHSNMTPSAISQVIEAVGKLGIGMLACWLLLKQGFGLEYGAAGAILGVTVGTVISTGYLIVNKVHVNYYGEVAAARDVPDSYGATFKQLVRIGVPITIGSSVLSILTLIDTKLVLYRLTTGAGFAELAAVELYGAYYNTQTLFNLPSSFIPALTMSVVPAITALLVKKDYDACHRISRASLRITTLVTLPMSAGLVALAWPILNLLYSSKPGLVENGAPLLTILGVAAFFVCIVLLTNALLQSYGKFSVPIKTMVAGGVVKIIINWVLVGTPSINITGAPIGTLVCYALIAALNLVALVRCIPGKLDLLRIILKPLIAAVLMGAAAWATNGLLTRVLGSPRLACVGAIAVGCVVYLVLVLVLRVIDREDLSVLPKGEKIAKILRIK